MRDTIDYESMTVPQLKQEAKRRGYKGVMKLRKPELIHLLETGELLDVASRIEGARVFEPEEVKSISDSFSGKYATRDKAIFLLGLCIGSRVSELCQLKVSDVWRNGKPVNTIIIRPETAKRKKARRVPIDVNPIAQNIISELIAWKWKEGESLEKEAPLFVSQKGGHLTRVQLHRILRTTYEAAGIEPERASTHSMRKTAATWLYEATRDIKCVQSFLGHSDSETTEQYIDLAFRVVREGVAKFSERLESVFDEENDAEKNDTKCQKLFQEIPLDENSRLPAVPDPNNLPSADRQIDTISEISLQIIEPEGATDRTVSTSQDFTLQTGEIPTDFTSATLKLPKESEDKFSITEPIPSKRTVEWKVTALKETSEDIPFTVEYKRQQQTIPIKASFISIRTVTRAELSIDKIDVPNNKRNDKDSIFSTGQQFTINITLTKSGTAQFEKESQGELQIEVPKDYTLSGKNKIPFSSTNDPISLTVTAPETLGSDRRKDAIKATILNAPNDENSNKEAYILVRSKETQITIEREGGLSVELSIISPDGAKDSIVSTKQEFSIQAQVIQTGAAKVKNPKITLTLPSGYEPSIYDEKKQETQDIPLTEEVSQVYKWDITAPSIKDEKFQNFTVDVKGIEENTGEETKSASDSLQIRTESAVTLKIDLKTLNTIGGLVKVNTPFIVEAIVINEGDAEAKGKGNLKIDFGDTGVTLAEGETDKKEFTVGVPVPWRVVAPSNPKDEGWITVSPTETWSITDGNSGTSVPTPAPGETSVKTIPENTLSAITRISEPPGATNKVVSTGQMFIVETSVSIPPGVATPTSTINVTNNETNRYEILDPISQKPVNNIVKWQVKAPPEPKTEQKITVVTKTTSPEQPQVENTISITTVQAATLKISGLQIIDPQGATDKTLSDGQTFTVEATISKGGDAKIEGVGEIELSTTPQTYTIIDDAIQRFPAFEKSTTVTWRLRAPTLPTEPNPTDRKGVITAKIKTAPDDENTNEPIKQELIGPPPQPIDVTIQKAAEIEITELKITEPERAKSGFLRTNEQFTISATINNLGEAGIDSKGKLVLTLPEGYQPADGLERLLELKKEISWKILSPSQPDSKSQQIEVRINPIPNDINTNAPAKVVSSVKGIPVYTPPVITIVDLVTIQFLKGEEIDVLRGEKVDATVSTAQRFIVKNKIIVPPEVTVKTSTIILPEGGGYTLVSPETQKVSLDGTVQWTVIAPNEPKYKMQIKVFSEGEKTDGTNVKSLEPFSSVSITTVTKAQLYVSSLKIISPPGATDQTVSTGQMFTVVAIVGNEGKAKTIGTGKLTINAPNYKITKPEEKTFSVGELVTWEVLAPEATVENAPIKVTITETPLDENTGYKADIIEAGKSASIDIKIEQAATLVLTDFKMTDNKDNEIKRQLDVKQQFYVYVSVEWNGDFLDPIDTKISLDDVPGYIVESPQERSLSEIINNNETFIKWTVTAPEKPDDSIKQISLEASPSPLDKNTGFPARVVMPPPIPVQTGRGELIVKLTGPKSDAPGPDQPEKEGNPWYISTEQEFTVQAEIRVGVSPEQYHLILYLPPGSGFTTSESLSEVPVNKDNKWYSEWIVTAPSNKVSEDLVIIKVTVEETPYLFKEIKVRLQTKAELRIDLLEIIKPETATNKEKNVVSTDQNFNVKVIVIKEGEADLEGGGVIKIEAEGYTITTPERTFLPGDFLDVEGSKKFERQWDMIAPKNPNKASSIRVAFSKLPNDDNTNIPITPWPEYKRIEVEVVQKAQVVISEITFNSKLGIPEENDWSPSLTITEGQSLQVRMIAENTGEAEATINQLKLDPEETLPPAIREKVTVVPSPQNPAKISGKTSEKFIWVGSTEKGSNASFRFDGEISYTDVISNIQYSTGIKKSSGNLVIQTPPILEITNIHARAEKLPDRSELTTGEKITVEITVSKKGEATASEVKLTVKPDQLSLVEEAEQVRNLGDIDTPKEPTIPFTYTTRKEGMITFTATITGKDKNRQEYMEPDTKLSNSLTISNPCEIKVIEIDYAPKKQIGINQSFEVTVTLENQGADASITPSDIDLSLSNSLYNFKKISPQILNLTTNGKGKITYLIETIEGKTETGNPEITVKQLKAKDKNTEKEYALTNEELGEVSITISVNMERPVLKKAFLIDVNEDTQVNEGDFLFLAFDPPITISGAEATYPNLSSEAVRKSFLLFPDKTEFASKFTAEIASDEFVNKQLKPEIDKERFDPETFRNGKSILITFDENEPTIETVKLEDGIYRVGIAKTNQIISISAGNSSSPTIEQEYAVALEFRDIYAPEILPITPFHKPIAQRTEILIKINNDHQPGLDYPLAHEKFEIKLDSSKLNFTIEQKDNNIRFISQAFEADLIEQKYKELKKLFFLIITFTDISPGKHEISVIVSDFAGNGRQEKISITVSKDPVASFFSYPNPFKQGVEEAIIRFDLNEKLPCKVNIYDVSGRIVRTFFESDTELGYTKEGSNIIKWKGNTEGGNLVGSGIYICELIAGKNPPKYWKIAVGPRLK